MSFISKHPVTKVVLSQTGDGNLYLFRLLPVLMTMIMSNTRHECACLASLPKPSLSIESAAYTRISSSATFPVANRKKNVLKGLLFQRSKILIQIAEKMQITCRKNTLKAVNALLEVKLQKICSCCLQIPIAEGRKYNF